MFQYIVPEIARQSVEENKKNVKPVQLMFEQKLEERI